MTPFNYEFGEHTIYNDEESLTEQEHKDACDINKMIRGALKGQALNMSQSIPQYGNDDLTMDAVKFRIQKATLEANLEKLSKTHEFTEEEHSLIPQSIREKYKFKIKAKKNDDSNDNKSSPKSNSINPDPKTASTVQGSEPVPSSTS